MSPQTRNLEIATKPAIIAGFVDFEALGVIGGDKPPNTLNCLSVITAGRIAISRKSLDDFTAVDRTVRINVLTQIGDLTKSHIVHLFTSLARATNACASTL